MTTAFRCPHCGAHLTVSAAGQQTGAYSVPFQERTMRGFNLGTGEAEAIRQATRVTPAQRQPTRESDVVVPFQKALITTGVLGVSVIGIAVASSWDGGEVIKFLVVGGPLTMAGAWLYFMRFHQSLLRVVETIVNRDIDGDGVVGEPPMGTPIPRVEVVVSEPNHYGGRISFLGFAVSPDDLERIARFAVSGRSITESGWSGRGKTFATRGDFNAFRDRLIDRGYAAWKSTDNRHGWEITERGLRFFEAIVKRATPPPQGGEGVENGA